MVDGVWRHRRDVPDIVGDVAGEQLVDVQGLLPAAPGRAGLAEDKNVFGHDVRVVVAGLGMLDEHPGALHAPCHLVPHDVLMELPTDASHALGNQHRRRVVLALVQDGADDDGAEPAIQGRSQHFFEDLGDVVEIVVEGLAEGAVFAFAVPGCAAVARVNVVVDGVPIRRRCDGQRDRRIGALLHLHAGLAVEPEAPPFDNALPWLPPLDDSRFRLRVVEGQSFMAPRSLLGLSVS